MQPRPVHATSHACNPPCKRPCAQVTQRHLRNIKQVVAASGAAGCTDMVTHAEGLTRTFYGRLSDGQLALMRQTLMRCAARDEVHAGLMRVIICAAPLPRPTPNAHTNAPSHPPRFFQDRRVRVSLFLAEGIQSPAGRIVLPSCHSHSGSSSDPSASSSSSSPPFRTSSGGGAGGGSDGATALAALGRVRTFDAAGRLEAEERHALAVTQVGWWLGDFPTSFL